MLTRRAVTKETFLIVEEDEQGSKWSLKLFGETETKEEAFERVKAGAIFDSTEAFVIPAYRGMIDWESGEAIPKEFANVEPKGELPNPVTSSQADGDPGDKVAR